MHGPEAAALICRLLAQALDMEGEVGRGKGESCNWCGMRVYGTLIRVVTVFYDREVETKTA